MRPPERSTREPIDYPVDLDPAATLGVDVMAPDSRPYPRRLFLGISPKNGGEGTSVGTSVDTDDAGRAPYRKIVPGEYVLHFQAEGFGKAALETRAGTGENFVSVRLA